MKLPLSWLREFVPVDLPLDSLLDVMGRSGLEVEDVRWPGRGTTGVRTARVVSLRPHPEADKLQLATVMDGTTEVEVVCGAFDFAVGDVVAYAAAGATLPGGFALERRTIRGVVSNGMLCSPRELELADDHSGILVLPRDTPVGVDLHELLPLGEPVVEIAVMADRGDHLSVLGVARDLAAILDLAVEEPPRPAPRQDGPVPVAIAALDACRHYVGWAVEGVEVGPSPWWLRRRLEACGIRSIGNVVDITNYVLLELGQPLHAFDLDHLHGPAIEVRWARTGERLATLDGRDRELRSTDLAIADADRAVALAGVMGGAESEVTEATSRILLEAAVFDPATVRRTSRRLGLTSEASLRFERRVDPEGAWRAAARAVELFVDLAGATDAGAADAGEGTWAAPPLRLDPRRTAALLGVDALEAGEQADLLRRARCEVRVSDGHLDVEVPSWRGDLVRPIDLVEEVARLYGYERIPASLPALPLRGGLTASQQAERWIREALLAAGFHEVHTRPFVGGAALVPTLPDDDRVVLANPLAKDASALRPGMVDGLLGVVRHNVGQGRPGVAVFEVGRVFRQPGGPLDDTLKAFGDAWRWQGPAGEALPTQPRVLGAAAQGALNGPGWVDRDRTWSVYDLLAAFDEVARRLAPPGADDWVLAREPVERPSLHPGRTARLLLRGVEVGVVGQLHPSEAEQRDLPEPVVVGELVVEALLEHLGTEALEVPRAPLLVRHPAVHIDVALVAPESLPYDELQAAVREGAGELLDGLWWFDEYRGEQIGSGRRSVAMSLRLQTPQRQLTDADAEAVIEAIAQAAERRGAALRR